MKKRYFFSILYFTLILFLVIINSFNAQALGVSPGRVSFTFVANKVYEGKVCYYPSVYPTVRVGVGGPFAEYVTLKGLNKDSQKTVTATDNCVEYTIRLPAKTDKYGLQRTVISAIEAPQNSGSGMFALVSIQSQIDIFVPYPYKYLDFGFNVQSVKVGENVPITISVMSKGDQNVTSAKGVITIYDNNHTQIGQVQTETEYDLKLDELRILNTTWNSTGFREGYYSAWLDLLYDGTKANATMPFKLGGLDVDITNYTKEVTKGGIKEFSVMVDSIWAETIQKVRAVVSVYNSSSTDAITSFETVSRDLAPWGNDILKGYLDTGSLKLGEYNIKIRLYFDDTTKDYDGKIKIVTEAPPKKPGIKINLFTAQNLLILMGVALAVILIILVYTLIPKKKKQAPASESKPK